MCSREKIPYKILFVWVIIIALMFIFSIPEVNNNSLVKNQSAGKFVNSIVLIAMGDLAEDSIVDSAIASIRVLGRWQGDIYLLTDRSDCFDYITRKHHLIVKTVPSVDNLIQIKAMKTQLFQYLPANVTSCLYMDVDILVTRSLDLFLGDIDIQISSHMLKNKRYPDFGMFLDARGHFFGFCSGCDKWHTGIIWLQNPTYSTISTPTDQVISVDEKSNCMTEWRNVLLSGRYTTDQQSIDYAEKQGHCPAPLAFSSRHLLFAKDYFAAFLTPARTFIHLTAVSRMDTQDPFYRYYIVPNIKSSLRPAGLNLKQYQTHKKCLKEVS